MSKPLPKWLEDYAQECRVLFGLESWDITVKLVQAPGDDTTNKGLATVDTRYFSALIEICQSLDRAAQRATLMHEMLHVAFAPMAQANFRIQELIPEKLREHAEALYTDGIEQTIERLTRALQREIKPHA